MDYISQKYTKYINNCIYRKILFDKLYTYIYFIYEFRL